MMCWVLAAQLTLSAACRSPVQNRYFLNSLAHPVASLPPRRPDDSNSLRRRWGARGVQGGVLDAACLCRPTNHERSSLHCLSTPLFHAEVRVSCTGSRAGTGARGQQGACAAAMVHLFRFGSGAAPRVNASQPAAGRRGACGQDPPVPLRPLLRPAGGQPRLLAGELTLDAAGGGCWRVRASAALPLPLAAAHPSSSDARRMAAHAHAPTCLTAGHLCQFDSV